MCDDNLKLSHKKDICILVTEADKTGQNVLAMSDFFDGYLKQLTESINGQVISSIPDMSILNLGIIGEVIKNGKTVSQGSIQWIPDYKHLPRDIIENLKKGVYKIGESRQVDGNVRAVIVDSKGVRVKDITFKVLKSNPETIEMVYSISNQLLLYQIFNKLSEIQCYQEYQNDRDRDQDIMLPFLNARRHILSAQGRSCTEIEKQTYLTQASEDLLSSINSLYLDIQTTTKHLIEQTAPRMFQRKRPIQKFIGFIIEDLNIVTKLVGLRMQVLGYLNKTNEIHNEMEQYKKNMRDLYLVNLPGKDITAAELIHMYYPYTDNNLNCWYDFSNKMKSSLENVLINQPEQIYMVSMEEGNE